MFRPKTIVAIVLERFICFCSSCFQLLANMTRALVLVLTKKF